MPDPKKTSHLRVVSSIADPESEDTRSSSSESQLQFFPSADPELLIFADVSRASAQRFTGLLREVAPAFVIDVRAVPRFDFAGMDRQTAFAIFQSYRSQYVDLAARLGIESRRDARWNPVFLKDSVSIVLQAVDAKRLGPIVLLFDDEALLRTSLDMLPSDLRPAPKMGWRSIVARCGPLPDDSVRT
jgi:hypothetical protein